MKKRIVAMLVCLVILIGIIPVQAFAATVISGYCGSNVKYSLSDTGTLTISGSGSMYSYNSDNTPWDDYSIKKQIKKVVIKEGVTSVGTYSFYFCENIESISLPSTIERIGEKAFSNCKGLRSINIPDGIRTIPMYTFNNCKSLERIQIPSSVQSFGQGAFDGCSSLVEFVIPEGVREISYGMFWNCSNLEAVQIPASVTEIDTFAFHECGNLFDIYYTGSYSQFSSITINNLSKYNEGLLYATIHYNTKMPCTICNYGSPVVTQAPTSSSAGKQVYTCQNCGGTKTESIPSSYAAKITTQPKSVTVDSGATAKVTVKASGKGLKYAWYYKEAGESSFKKSSITTSSYSTSMTSARDGRKVYCEVTDQYGTTVKSSTVTLSMRHYAKIKTQPTNVVVSSGKTASVKVVATGDGLTYTWYYKDSGASSYSKSSTTSSTYSAQMNSARSGRKVYCVVKDKYGTSVKSNVVTLYCGKAAKITTQPKNALAANGKTASVKVAATGDGLTYTWYYKDSGASSYSKSSTTSSTYSAQMNSTRDGRKVYCVVKDKYGTSVKSDVVTLYMGTPAKITTQPKSVSVALNATVSTKVVASGTGLKYVWYYKDAGASSYSKSSITSATYSTTMTTARSGRQVYCVVTDKFGNSVKSNVVTLRSKVVITTQPSNKVGEVGTTISTKVAASGEGKTYTWYFKNPGESSYSKSSITTATYSMKVTSANNGRMIYCVVKDKYGNTAKTDVVTMYAGTPAKITTQPADVAVESGSNAKVSVEATGSGLTYTWYYKDSGASSFSKSSTTSSTYSTQMNSVRNGRQVYCVVTDKYGTTVKSDVVTLSIIKPVTITSQPSNAYAYSGYSATVSLSASGDGLTYTWYYKDPYSSYYSASSSNSSSFSQYMSSYYSGTKVYCVVTDKYGNSVTSNTVTLYMYSSSSSTSKPSTSLSTIADTWYSTVVVGGGSAGSASGASTLYVYSYGSANLYLNGTRYSFNVSYSHSSGSYYYYKATFTTSGSSIYFVYDYEDDELCVMINGSNGLFFER